MNEPSGESVPLPTVEAMPKVYVQWDEPGAGTIVIDGHDAVRFNLETNWSETWDPKVDPIGLAFLDRLPRWAQEVEHAYWCAKEYQKRATPSGGPG